MKTEMTMIINSILWAAAMIGSALVLAGTGYSEKIFDVLFFLWFASFLLMLQKDSRSIKSEWACIRRLFSSASREL